jgi:DNA-binding Xre family transcriptional regulator
MTAMGKLSLLLAERRAGGKDVTRIEQLAQAAGINRYMLDQLDQGRDLYANLDSLRRVGEVLELDSLNHVLGLPPPQRTGADRIYERPIKTMTERKGISMRQLAAHIGVRPASLYNLDIGQAKLVRISHLVEICRILELSIDELVGYRPPAGEAAGGSESER